MSGDRVVVVVPYRGDGGARDRVWAFLYERFWVGLGWPVVLADGGAGPFNRSAAINAAADRAWDVAVIADADTWVPVAQLGEALRVVKASGRLVAAFDRVRELDGATTERLLEGGLGLGDVGAFTVERTRSTDIETQSSMLVVGRRLWDDIGGFDTRFTGWGGEDNAFWRAAHILSARPLRVAGSAFHCWHPPAPGKRRGEAYRANVALWQRYGRALTAAQLRAVQSR